MDKTTYCFDCQHGQTKRPDSELRWCNIHNLPCIQIMGNVFSAVNNYQCPNYKVKNNGKSD